MTRPLPRINLVIPGAAADDAQELPLRILVLADLTQRPDPRPLAARPPVVLARDSFDPVMAEHALVLDLAVPDPCAAEPGAQTRVQLTFARLKDFEPGSIARQMPQTRRLLELRESLNALKGPLGPVPSFKRRLNTVLTEDVSRAQIQYELAAQEAFPRGATTDDTLLGALLEEAKIRPPQEGYDLVRRGLGALLEAALSPPYAGQALNKELADQRIAALDAEITRHVRAVLHHPDFVRLETTWRSLRSLVDRVDGRDDIVLEALSCTNEALREDFEDAAALQQSGLFQQLHGAVSAVPYGLVVADFALGVSRDDLWLLRRCGAVAAALHAPFLADAAPDLLDPEASAGWQAFRHCEEARYVGLCMPRVLLRLPYGAETVPVKWFNFEELDAGDAGHRLWGSAAAAVASMVAAGFAGHAGWHTPEGALPGRIEGLPLHAFLQDDTVVCRAPTAQPFCPDDAHRLAAQGVMALVPAEAPATPPAPYDTTWADLPVACTCFLPASEGDDTALSSLLRACRTEHLRRGVSAGG